MKRPISILAITLVQSFVSLTSLASGIILLLLTTGRVRFLSQDLSNIPLYLKGLIGLGMAISLWGVVVTYGLWQLKRWGWLGSLMFQLMCVVNNGLAVVAGQSMTVAVYVSTTFCIASIGVLWMPRVRQVITPDPTPDPIELSP
jgi:hypothetical protein